MGQKEKLLRKLRESPKAFTFEDAVTLLGLFDYSISNKGKTSGSRVAFLSKTHPPIFMHKPHPQKELKAYQAKQLIDILQQEGLL